ncbi:sorting nexin-2-like [Oppia nitens]|uniref:sorting nexin-2-like n=1 Tax=Oppia nitens TaxID=1686743 RepID=UPI0023DBBB7A|nr:sorting nexin-2-like [Oppia nitens]
MAETGDHSTVPPPRHRQTRDLFDSDGDDDSDTNEDLFVSTVESHPVVDSNETKLEPKNNIIDNNTTFDNPIGDLIVSHEINLDDDDDSNYERNSTSNAANNSSKQVMNGIDGIGGRKVVTNDLLDKSSTLPIDSTKAILSTTSSITSSAIDSRKPNQDSSISSSSVTNKISSNERHINVTVGEPQRIGEGMSSYVVYKVETKTDYPYFRRSHFSVNRRFSDFLGLHDKLSEKHLHLGRIIPPTPEKNAVGMAKVKMSSKEESLSSSQFVERRRAALERYLNRNALHPTLCADPDFREFLELDTDLPKATNTSALSGAGVKRLLSRVGDTVNKMTFRMDESDPWFEEKQNQIENLDQQLRKLYTSVEALIHHRKELTQTTGAFARSAAMLGNCEEHTSLSCALSQLAETQEKVEQLYNKQVDNDFVYLGELLKDYIAMIGAVKDAFHQRVKVFQMWQHSQQMLTKKREIKAKLELALKTDKLSQANDEVLEWESKVSRGQEEFESISKTIRLEVERFEVSRIRDFKDSIIKYMESLLDSQQQLIKYWEAFLPEAKAIA